ncbi:MAG: type III-B CRISPR module RAMP protein Cmr1 [Verrucomicrobiales bacterium]|nr:type III-B CRISPR module RAMP protein Cmr1 [Verrucomicrobiae bacterium]
MLPSSFDIRFITPLFSRGMYENLAEVRPPSIRGHLRWWFRALGGNLADENAVFGGIHGTARASRVIVRVSGVAGRQDNADTLIHKHGREARPRMSFLPGASFTLHLLPRLGGPDGPHLSQFERALKAWLLMGSLGLRATRGAGSFVYDLGPDASGPVPPASAEVFEKQFAELLEGTQIQGALLGSVYPTAESARWDCSDTLGGRSDRRGTDDLAVLSHPLGSIKPVRKTSPLRFRVVALEGRFRILALWDARTSVTHNSLGDLHGAIRLLVERKPALGKQLEASPLAAH